MILLMCTPALAGGFAGGGIDAVDVGVEAAVAGETGFLLWSPLFTGVLTRDTGAEAGMAEGAGADAGAICCACGAGLTTSAGRVDGTSRRSFLISDAGAIVRAGAAGLAVDALARGERLA